MNVELTPATALGETELAELFTAVYAGYPHPIVIDVAGLRRMVATHDLDLDASVVALDGEVPVALGVLAIRVTDGWVGGMGVLPDRRGGGLGTRVGERLLGNAGERGLQRVRLEVLEQNAPAIAVYRRLGFADLRPVAVWRLDSPPEAAARADDAELPTVLTHLADTGGRDAPWQRSSATLARLHDRGAELVGVRALGGAAVFSAAGAQATLHQLSAPTVDTASALLAAPFARGARSLLWLNGPIAGVAADALQRAGATVLARQRELVWQPAA